MRGLGRQRRELPFYASRHPARKGVVEEATLATIIKFPRRGIFADAVRVEREHGGDGWLAIARNHGWSYGDFYAALCDARSIASGFGVSVRSSAGVLSCS